MTEPLVITEPGVYDLPANEYFADPVPAGSLSSSGARRLLSPGCPALYRYEREHGQPPKAAYDFGHAAHLQVLGEGPELVLVDADDWRTKAAREARDEAHKAGKTPLLPAAYNRAKEMARVLREHPFAGRLFAPGTGRAEQSLFWTDELTGIWRRARLDWLPDSVPGQRLIIPDYKTTDDASPEAISKSVHNYGYHCQADWYVDGVKALGLAEQVVFVLVFQSKNPPHLVTVTQLDTTAMAIGEHLNRAAINIYANCVKTGQWPSYSDDVIFTGLPAYAEAQFSREYNQ